MKKNIILVLICLLLPVFAYADTLSVTTDKATYARGEVMRVTAVYKRNDGTPITSPSTREVRIRNTADVTMAQTSMTNAGNGVYTYNYTISSSASTGTWEVRGKFVYNGVETKKYTYPVISSTTADTTAPVTTASPAGGTYSSAQSVTLTRNESGTTYYTTDGSTPVYPVAGTTQTYSAPIYISSTKTLKYFSRDTAGNVEAVKSALYTIGSAADTTAPVTTASPAAGTYSTAQSVTLTRNESGTTYFTTDGTTPVYPAAGTTQTYSAPISIASTRTLKYFSRDTAGNIEAVKTGVYTISTTKTHDISNTSLVWTGYNTCLSCHRTQSAAMYQGVHYQWKASGAKMTTGPAASQGKMDALDGSSALNAYCINILGGWTACGACHAGTGAKPVATATPTDAQLSSIDCLMCHKNGTIATPYVRTRNVTTGLFEPNAGIDMNMVVRTVTKPSRNTCLGCHAKAGGGDAVKRGDIALANGTSADAVYDVHMATSRGNLSCQSCHVFNAHRVAGRGSDLRPQDSTAAVNCATSTCHPTKTSLTSGHSTSDVNHHIGRVACQTCHLPKYAKNANDTAATEATETNRTWAASEWNATLNRYEPLPTKANDLAPKYAFWNGKSWGNNLGDVAVIDPKTGFYQISRPVGAVNDPAGTKLYPFKYKTAQQPLDTTTGKLIGLNTATFFATANYNQAVLDGLAGMGRSGDAWTTVTTDEYQALNHQIPPATGNVLTCTSCHPETTTTKMKLKTDFGYGLKGTLSAICIQCHGSESNPGFTSVHSRHVANYKYDCSFCHNFSRATERGLRLTK